MLQRRVNELVKWSSKGWGIFGSLTSINSRNHIVQIDRVDDAKDPRRSDDGMLNYNGRVVVIAVNDR